jgi:DNA replication protein DnaC
MEYIQCRKCRKPKPKNKPQLPKGFYYEEVERNGTKYLVAKECECHKRWEKENNLEKKLLKNGFKKEYLDWQLNEKSFLTDIKRINSYLSVIDNPLVQNSVLYIWGKSSQKESLSTYIGKTIIEKGFTCSKISFPELSILLHDNNLKESEELESKVEDLKNCDILIIDKFFDEFQSLWGSYALSLFETRITDKKGLIFFSKTDPNKIDSLIGRETSRDKGEVKYRYALFQDFILEETNKTNSVFYIEDIPNLNGPNLENLF